MPHKINATNELVYSLKREVNELYWATAIRNFATGLVGVFVPISVYLYTQSVTGVILFYLAQYLGHMLLVPLGGKLLPRLGVKKMMAVANPFLAAYLVLLVMAEIYGLMALIAAVAAKIIYLVLFLPAQNIDFAKFAQDGERGKQVGNLNIIATLASSVAPLVGGFALLEFGFMPVFATAAILMIVSSVPLFFSPEVYETYTMSWWRSFTRMFSRRNRRDTLVFFFKGVEEAGALVFWPLFIYLVIENLETIGLITSLSLIAVLLFTYFVGRESDRRGERKVIARASIFHAFAWIVSAFIINPLQYLIYSSFLNLAATANRIPLSSLIYRKAQKRGHGVDEYLTGYEIGVEIGLVTTLALAAGLWGLGVTNWLVYFGIAAVGALGFRFIREK